MFLALNRQLRTYEAVVFDSFCRILKQFLLVILLPYSGVVASACKEFQELRLFPSDLHGVGYAAVTEEGLVAISVRV